MKATKKNMVYEEWRIPFLSTGEVLNIVHDQLSTI
jgi:hypothetical protein